MLSLSSKDDLLIRKKLSKDEMVRMIRYGAEKVFRSKDSTITDDDIDAIMSRGERKTADMNSKLQEHVKGDMLDFKLEYSTSMQKFDGIDYSKRNKQEEERRQLETLGFIHKISDAQGKRQRTVKTSYNDNEYFKSISFANPRVPSTYRHGKGPRWLKLPPMQFWRMYSAERIGEIHAAELQLYEKWVRDRTRAGEENPRGDEDEPSPLATKNPDMYAEKQRLLAEGFPLWSRMDYIHFYKACAQCGRENYADIAKAMNLMLKDKTASLKTADDVEAYSLAFWSRGRNHFQNFSKMVKVIEKGEKKLGEMTLLLNCLKKKIAMYKSPHEQFEFHYSGANNSRGKNYTMNADVCLLLLVQKHGFGQWDAIRSDIQRSKRLCFEYFLRTRTNRELKSRTLVLLRIVQREFKPSGEWKQPKSSSLTAKQKNRIKDMESQLEVLKKEREEILAKPLQSFLTKNSEVGRDLLTEAEEKMLANVIDGELHFTNQPELVSAVITAFKTSGDSKLQCVTKNKITSAVKAYTVKEKKRGDKIARYYMKKKRKPKAPKVTPEQWTKTYDAPFA